MNPSPAVASHHQICDELHQLTLEENRFLRQHQRPPEAALLTRKRALLEKLEQSLETLRALPAGSVREPAARELLEKTRTRILQVLQLDKENEQLLLRCSLAQTRPAASAAATAPATLLQRIYARCA